MDCLSDDVVGEITEVHWVCEECTLLQTLYLYVLVVIREHYCITQCEHTKIKRSCVDLCFSYFWGKKSVLEIQLEPYAILGV